VEAGARLAAFHVEHGGNADIYRVEGWDTSWINLTQDPASDNWPVWSPDATRIAFQSKRSGNLDIWLLYSALVGDGSDDDYDLSAVALGGEPVRLTGGPGRQLEGRWKGGR
jgi:hypothetical protein